MIAVADADGIDLQCCSWNRYCNSNNKSSKLFNNCCKCRVASIDECECRCEKKRKNINTKTKSKKQKAKQENDVWISNRNSVAWNYETSKIFARYLLKYLYVHMYWTIYISNSNLPRWSHWNLKRNRQKKNEN